MPATDIASLNQVLALLATVVFSITGVLAARSVRIDIFGIVVVGVVTAVGGGTIRDLILDAPVFWVAESIYLLAAVLAAAVAFFLLDSISRRYTWLLYLDALGVALFASSAIVKTLNLGFGATTAAVMGVITGIGGGLIRDLLTSRPSLILSRDLYATPILFGVLVQLLLMLGVGIEDGLAALVGGSVIFVSRAGAIYFHWQTPDWLTTGLRDHGDGL